MIRRLRCRLGTTTQSPSARDARALVPAARAFDPAGRALARAGGTPASAP
ncbi:hypothetical protein WMF31_11205 [Sorangium sp. So ce1036]